MTKLQFLQCAVIVKQHITIFTAAPLYPIFLRGDADGPKWISAHIVVALQERNTELRNPESSIVNVKYACPLI
jgi:hypothetical protein